MEKSCYCCNQHDSSYDACVTGLKVKVSNGSSNFVNQLIICIVNDELFCYYM